MRAGRDASLQGLAVGLTSQGATGRGEWRFLALFQEGVTDFKFFTY